MKRMLQIFALPTICIVLLAMLPPAAGGATNTITLSQVWQHKDTTMTCTAPGGTSTVHAVDHAVNPAPGGAHCGYYCAPASISMYSLYRGNSGAQTRQDDIYDSGKFSQGETPGDRTIQTHGVGMFSAPAGPGVGGAEVQAAFTYSVGTLNEWGSTFGPPLTGSNIITLINGGTPILWVDHGGYPSAVNPPLPTEWLNVNGHVKVIAGYDDKGTPIVSDDEYYIYDPWPTSGSPYWAPYSTVVNTTDLYITDSQPVPNEQSSIGELKSSFDRK